MLAYSLHPLKCLPTPERPSLSSLSKIDTYTLILSVFLPNFTVTVIIWAGVYHVPTRPINYVKARALLLAHCCIPISGTWEVPSKHLLTVRRNCLESWFSPAPSQPLWHIILAIVPHLISPKFRSSSLVQCDWYGRLHLSKMSTMVYIPSHMAFLKIHVDSPPFEECVCILSSWIWPGLDHDGTIEWHCVTSGGGNKRWDIEFASFSWVSPSENTALFYADIQAMWRDDV